MAVANRKTTIPALKSS